MAYVIIDEDVDFAIDAAAKSSTMKTLNLNIKDHEARLDSHDHVTEGAAITDAAHAVITAGSTYNIAWEADNFDVSHSNSSYIVLDLDTHSVNRIIIPRDGTYQVDFDVKGSGGTSGFGRVYKNGVALGTEQSSLNWATKSENLTFAEGDYVELYTKISASETVSIRDFKIMSAVKRLG